jgi:hypothetical protein
VNKRITWLGFNHEPIFRFDSSMMELSGESKAVICLTFELKTSEATPANKLLSSSLNT